MLSRLRTRLAVALRLSAAFVESPRALRRDLVGAESSVPVEAVRPLHVADPLNAEDPRRPLGPFDESVIDLVVTIDADDLANSSDVLAKLSRVAGETGMTVHAVVYEVEESVGRTHATPTLPEGLPLVSSRVARGWSTALVKAFPRLRGGRVIVIDSSVDVESDALIRLGDQLVDDVAFAQVVVLNRNDTVASAGALFGEPRVSPSALFSGFPSEDAFRSDVLEVDAGDRPVFAVRTRDLGEPPATVDIPMAVTALSLAVARTRGAASRIVSVPSGRVYERRAPIRRLDQAAQDLLEEWTDMSGSGSIETLARAGFRVVAPGVLPTASQPARIGRPVIGRMNTTVHESPPRLRWSIKTAAWAGSRGDDWGDVFFARDLAQGLRELGQDVVIDNRQSFVRPESEHLDDVSLVLRGLDRIPPVPEAVNVLWVISHPDLVTASELRGFDLRYSAGPAWGDRMSKETGLDISTLLQATNPARFFPGEPDESIRSDVLFVGKTRNIFRPIVRDALAAGLDLSVWGEGWSAMLPPDVVKGDFLPNEMLPAAYRSSRIVLNDHWADMAREGFVSNRVFDAVAVGATVVSDEIAGVHSLFGEAVRTYGDVSELAALSASIGDDLESPQRLERARHVAVNHSFVRRAGVLLDDVTRRLAHQRRQAR